MRASHAAQAVGFYALAVAAAGQEAGPERRLQAAAEAHWDFWADETDHMYTGGTAINCARPRRPHVSNLPPFLGPLG